MSLKPYRGLRLYIYKDPSTRAIRYPELTWYLQEHIPHCTVEVRDEFLTYAREHWGAEPRRLSPAIASARVIDVLRCEPVGEPLPGEVTFEERILSDPARRVGGVLYEGYTLQNLFQSLIPREELRLGILHAILTQRMLVTKELGDGRGHARTIILGQPVLISTTGLVEAPALPREVYVKLQLFRSPDMQQLLLEEERRKLGELVLSPDDERLTEVVKGYVLMGVFYYLFGEAFCDDMRCRLYNAHTHEELVEAQIRSGRLCTTHQQMLDSLKTAPAT
ncbi:hypothetical protein HRbin02_01148 [Candidatus Calditenuaceae archaeon HR02]|nr:hypothetical protein HRbin02_01148 [Candidatus Calditenuaceae archaeon HR02]